MSEKFSVRATFSANIQKDITAETSEEASVEMHKILDDIVDSISEHCDKATIKLTPGLFTII